jgi:MSHA biogenesis protein MshP
MNKIRKPTEGFILISVLFLIAVLAVIAVVMASTSAVQHFTNVYSVQAARAYFAARSGLEYAIDRAATAGVCTNGNVALTGINFTVNVSCAAVAGINEAGTVTTVYTINSTATSGTLGSINFVTRSVRATIN